MRRALMTQARRRRDRRRAAASAAVVACLLAARRINRWGATAQEVARVLPGDQEVSDPALATTRAISVGAPAEAVWPWLVQMGWHRAGWLFVVEPIDAEHSRLIERGRTAVTGRSGSLRGALAGARSGGLGLAAADFLMAHHHMTGIRQRAEREWLKSGSIVDHGGMGKDGM